MPKPSRRSRSMRKVFRKVPGARISVQYKKRKPNAAKCGNCGAVLKGIPRLNPIKMRNLAKTMRRPQRPYGGVLCSKCLRNKMIEKFRQ